MTNPIDNESLYDAITLGGVRSPGVVTLSGFAESVGWDVRDVAVAMKAYARTQQAGKEIANSAARCLLTPTDARAEDLDRSVRTPDLPDFACGGAFGRSRANSPSRESGGGQDGASVVRKGREPASGTASFYLVYDLTLGVDEFAQWEDFVRVLRATFGRTSPVALDVYHPDLALLHITSVVVRKIGVLQHDGKGGATATIELLEYRPPKPKRVEGPVSATSAPKRNAAPDPQRSSEGRVTRVDAMRHSAGRARGSANDLRRASRASVHNARALGCRGTAAEARSGSSHGSCDRRVERWGHRARGGFGPIDSFPRPTQRTSIMINFRTTQIQAHSARHAEAA